jgi:hypothetical protein
MQYSYLKAVVAIGSHGEVQEDIMIEGGSNQESHHPSPRQGGARNANLLLALQPKGSCWYCDQPVDNVRRFCSSSCRDDYLEEEAEFGSEQ